MCHSSVDVAWVAVIFKVFVIGKNCDGKWGAEKEEVVVSETSVYGEEFTIMDVVVLFCLIEGLGVETHCYMFSSFILLGKDGSCGKCRGIYLEEERATKVRLVERGVIQND
jgi:hypothetical protein